jgi:predicted AlkP superfamily phosphohydrolase/phosphomutase
MLVIGLDSADPSLVEKWSEEGILPTLRLLRKEGTRIHLKHDRAIPSASVWPSIYTGSHPGKHGIYNGLQLEPGQQTVDFIKPSHCAQPPFWQALDRTGNRSIIIDVPFNYPLTDFSGIQILDWGTYERHYDPHSLPGEIVMEISKRFGTYPFGREMSRNAPTKVRHYQRVRAQLLAGISLKGSVVKWLVTDRSWDFLMAVFSETHPAGHYFWSFHSDGLRRLPFALPAEFRTTIRDVYKAVDKELAKIIEDLDEKTTLLVLSGQGMGPNSAQWHLIPDVLSKLGLLVTKTKSDRRGVTRTHWLGEVRDLIPLSWRRSVSRYLPGTLRDQLRSYWATARIDWSRTRAFYLPTDLLGYIRINLKGREPQGLVHPGSEYDDICNHISSALKELIHPRTGKRIVREVFHTNAIFAGPERDRLPDLIVTWRDGINEAHSPQKAGTINGDSPDPRSGNHRPQGFALLYGPGIGKGQAAEGRIVDIAPTVLKYFGITPPSDIDGRPLPNIFC